MDYDVLILGGGIIGCAAAYELSKYSLNVALIEKNYDIAEDVALVNTATVYDGIECEDSMMAKLELMGNRMLDEVTERLNVPFKRCGSLIIASNMSQQKKIEEMYERAIKRGIENISLMDFNATRELEPNLNIEIKSSIYSKNMGVICPYDLAIAYGEVAFDNGVNFKLEEEVLDVQKISRGYRVVTNKNKFTCKIVLDTIPSSSIDGIETEEKEENKVNLNYFLLEKNFKENFSNIIFTLDENGEKSYVVPTVQGNTIAAIAAKKYLNYSDTLKKVSALVPEIKEEDLNAYYRAPFSSEPILIDDSSIDKGYIKVTGKHYAKVTMTPSIGKLVCETITSNTNCKLKKDFTDKRRDFYKFREMSNEERNSIIKLDKRYGKVVCLCNLVTEGEIVDSIRRPLGARTVEGIKRRTGVTLGNCQGSYCVNKIISILARETNKSFTDIVKDSKSSKMVIGRIKEFDGV
jgi:L-2-hydroxyglutarate oxidase LhgO